MVFYPCDFEANAEDARYVVSRIVVDYLHERFGEEGMLERCATQSDSFTRRWFRWRNEMEVGLIEIGKLDDFLIPVFHGCVRVEEFPPEAFSFRKINRKDCGTRIKVERQAKYAQAVVERGAKPSQIAKQLGCHERTVQNWAKRYRAGTLAA